MSDIVEYRGLFKIGLDSFDARGISAIIMLREARSTDIRANIYAFAYYSRRIEGASLGEGLQKEEGSRRV